MLLNLQFEITKLWEIGLFNIYFGQNQILEFCFLKQIETTQKIVDSNGAVDFGQILPIPKDGFSI